MKLQKLLLIPIVCFGFLPKAQAVVPPPDGGYPGFTTAEGNQALQNLTTGVGNTAAGWHSLFANTTGNLNTAIGAGTLLLNTGDNNTATGALALLLNTTGGDNTANGAYALFSNTYGAANTATGDSALYSNTNRNGNTAMGYHALQDNTAGEYNTATGLNALYHNTTGTVNTANGQLALASNTTGDGNTATGLLALGHNTTGSDNIALGIDAGRDVTSANNVICIGAYGNNVDNSCFIGNIFSSTVSESAVFVNSNGRLGTMTSSKRFKQDIKPMDNVSEALYSLKPVSFRYKKEFDPTCTSQLGLVAEDVEAVNPELVVRDKEGKPYSVRYEAVNAMLLNEFLKEHRKVQEEEATIALLKSTDAKQEAIITELTSTDAKQEATIAKQQRQIERLTEGLQKVSAQLEASKPAPQMVNNP